MTLPCWACDAGLGLAGCWVSSGALCKIPSFFTFRWVCSAPSSGRSTEIPQPSLSLATKPWLRGREGIFARAPPVHPSPGKCRRQTAGFILVPANHKLICLLMQLLPVHVFPNEEHQNANLSSGVHQPPELTAVTRLEAVLLTSASCALSLALIFLLSGHFFPTDLFFFPSSQLLSCSVLNETNVISHTHAVSPPLSLFITSPLVLPRAAQPDSTGGGQQWLHSGHAPQGKSLTFP